MKKILKTILKILIFFFAWAVAGGLLINIDVNDPVINRFLWELIPFLLVALDSLIFWLVEKRRIVIVGYHKAGVNAAAGLVLGTIWVLVPIAGIYFTGKIAFSGPQQIAGLPVWIIALFLNAIMQELLCRGYIYRIIKRDHNIIAAMVVSIALFTFMHGFESIFTVILIATMALAMSIILEYTGSLVMPIMMHAVYNIIESIILGKTQIAEYPQVFQVVIAENAEARVEKLYNWLILICNVSLCIVFGILWYKKAKRLK